MAPMNLNTMSGRITKAAGKKLTVQELYEMIIKHCGENSISKGTVATALSDNTKTYNFTARNLIALAKTLNVSTDYLLGLSQDIMDSDSESLGLSDKSAELLESLSEYERIYGDHLSNVNITTAKKKLDMINWILEHETKSDDSFLLLLYYYIMCNFASYKHPEILGMLPPPNTLIKSNIEEILDKWRVEYQ